MDVSVCLTIDCCIPFIHDLRDFVDVYVNQLNICYVTHLGALMRSHRGINVMLIYMHRLSLVDVHGKKSFKFLCMLLIMYGIKQVHRMHVRLATGPGGLKSTRILAPVAVRISGALQRR